MRPPCGTHTTAKRDGPQLMITPHGGPQCVLLQDGSWRSSSPEPTKVMAVGLFEHSRTGVGKPIPDAGYVRSPRNHTEGST